MHAITHRGTHQASIPNRLVFSTSEMVEGRVPCSTAYADPVCAHALTYSICFSSSGVMEIFATAEAWSAVKNSLVVCDESGHTKFPFSFVVLSWGELWLICPELLLILP